LLLDRAFLEWIRVEVEKLGEERLLQTFFHVAPFEVARVGAGGTEAMSRVTGDSPDLLLQDCDRELSEWRCVLWMRCHGAIM